MVDSPSDQELCERVARSDRDALEILYRRYVGEIIRFLRLLGCPPDWVEDGTHEVFIKVWRALERGQNPEQFRLWIRRIAHNVLVDYWRRPQYRREIAGEAPDAGVLPVDVDTVVDVARALSQLDWNLREILVLHFYQGLTLEDIATVVGIPSGTVKSRLARAYRRLAVLVQDGAESPQEMVQSESKRLAKGESRP